MGTPIDPKILEAIQHRITTMRELCQDYIGQDTCTSQQIEGVIINGNAKRMDSTMNELCKEAANGIPMPQVLSDAGLDPHTPTHCPTATLSSSQTHTP